MVSFVSGTLTVTGFVVATGVRTAGLVVLGFHAATACYGTLTLVISLRRYCASYRGFQGEPKRVVFRLWQCDKDNHGWREGPPVTVLCQSLRSAGRAFTLRQRQSQTEKEYSFALLAACPHSAHWPV
jgi:hypothetical protein